MAEPTTTAPGPAHLRRSPLHHLHDRIRAASTPAVRLAELPFLTMTALRVDPAGPAADRVGKVLGAALPTRCGDTARAGARTALWLGPDEWLVVSGDDEPGALTDELRRALTGDHGAAGSVVDVSANRTTLALSGPFARHVLEKGCPLDLHPRSFAPGSALVTQVGPVPVVLWQTGEEPAAPAYRLLPRASFADHLTRWLIDAMAEYAHPEVP
ncbi:sarcosine oxidase subunit gamma family protein [Streptomyces sp. SID5910]|uniref:sarcosine oxidase subunit gamma n=1 Tax=Streptomyces sp. SID5910 TaxID=2690312 RepID=UPI0013712DD8|nr:sarcosine oxidase subunit gamma family protein [Streptomyces sp. SID5910]MYR44503.1 sarcosine oxidase subunit gamma [Streptomyces sp. SID5910]